MQLLHFAGRHRPKPNRDARDRAASAIDAPGIIDPASQVYAVEQRRVVARGRVARQQRTVSINVSRARVEIVHDKHVMVAASNGRCGFQGDRVGAASKAIEETSRCRAANAKADAIIGRAVRELAEPAKRRTERSVRSQQLNGNSATAWKGKRGYCDLVASGSARKSQRPQPRECTGGPPVCRRVHVGERAVGAATKIEPRTATHPP